MQENKLNIEYKNIDEVQITRDISDTVSALDGYGITEEQIRAVYKRGK